MYLKKLTIRNEKTGKRIREIHFRKGLNLITNTDNLDNESNSFGKSTVLKSIDFCLGAKVKEMYDNSSKSYDNTIMGDFLYNNEISFELVIECAEHIHTICRRFLIVKKRNGDDEKKTKIHWDGYEITLTELTGNLKAIFFGDREKSPSFRELIKKFLRTDTNSLGDALKFYYGNDKINGRSIHDRLFLSNSADIISEEKRLNILNKKGNTEIIYLNNRYSSITELECNLKNLTTSMVEPKEIINEFFKENTPSKEFDEYKDLLDKRNKYIQEVLFIETEIDNIKYSINKYSNDTSDINVSLVKSLYEEMKIYNSSLNKTFEETLKFHNSAVSHRVKFLKDSLLLKTKELLKTKNIEKAFNEKLDGLYILKENKTLEEYVKFSDRNIQILAEIKQLTSVLSEWKSLEKEMSAIDQQLMALNISQNENQNLKHFNTIFKKYTNTVYKEEVWVNDRTNEGPYKLEDLTEIGTGKEKGIITLFDLAYISFIDELNIIAPKFAATDIFEPSDEPTIKEIFDIANSLDGQLIIPVIRDKVKFYKNYETYIILELSKDDKFFKY